MIANTFTDFSSLPDSARRLFVQATEHSVFLAPVWFELLAEKVFSKANAQVICAMQGEQCLAAVPVIPASQGWVRQLSGLSNYYASYFSPVIADTGDTGEALAVIAKAIREAKPGWDILDFQPMPHDDPIFGAWQKALRQAGFSVQDYYCFGNWFLRLDGHTFKEYYDGLSSRLKNTIKRRRKKLEKQAQLSLRIFSGTDELEEAIAHYQQIYAASWKQDEPYPAFVPGLIRMGARQGWLRLGMAYVDGQPAAAQIWLIHAGIANIYKLAYDEKFAEFSVGSILSLLLFEQAIDQDKVWEVDYLTGDDNYKKDWMSHRRERWGLMAFNTHRPMGLLAMMRHTVPRRIKQLLGRADNTGSTATNSL